MRIINEDKQERMTKCNCCNTIIAYKNKDIQLDMWNDRYVRCPICKQKIAVSIFDRKIKCKHKRHKTANEIHGGDNEPDGIITEYDIVCEECGEYLAHWAYGTVDPKYYLNYELTGLKKLKAKFRYYIIDQIKAYFSNKIDELYHKNNNDLPF